MDVEQHLDFGRLTRKTLLITGNEQSFVPNLNGIFWQMSSR